MKFKLSQTLCLAIGGIFIVLGGCTFTPHDEYISPVKPPEPISVSFIINDPSFKDPYYLIASTQFNFRLKDLNNPISRSVIRVDGSAFSSEITKENSVSFVLNPGGLSVGTHTISMQLFVDTKSKSLLNILDAEFYVVEQSFSVIVDPTPPTFSDPLTVKLENGFLTFRWKAPTQKNFKYKIKRSGSGIGFLPDTLINAQTDFFIDPGYVGGMLNYQITAVGLGFEKVIGSGSLNESPGDFNIAKDADRVVRLSWSKNFVSTENTKMIIQFGANKKTLPFSSSGNVVIDTLGLREGLYVYVNFVRAGYSSQMTQLAWDIKPTPNLKPFEAYAMVKQKNKLLIATKKMVYRYSLQNLTLEDSLSLASVGIAELQSLIISPDESKVFISGGLGGLKSFDPLDFKEVINHDIDTPTREFTDPSKAANALLLGNISNGGLLTIMFWRGQTYTMVLDINEKKAVWHSSPGMYDLPVISNDGNFLAVNVPNPYRGQVFKWSENSFIPLGGIDLGDRAFLPNGKELINFSMVANYSELTNNLVSTYNLLAPPLQSNNAFSKTRSATIIGSLSRDDGLAGILYDPYTNLLALRYLETTKLMEPSTLNYVKTISGHQLFFTNNYILNKGGFIDKIQ